MPKEVPRRRRLKVFQAQIGFYDTVVAVSSKAAALRAWGTRQDLFAEGHARRSCDAQAVKAALAHPETLLRRAIGSDAPFSAATPDLPTIPDARKTPAPRAKPAKKAASRAPSADRSKLEAAEERLRQLDEERVNEEAKLKRRQNEIEDEISTAQHRYIDERKSAKGALLNARKAFRDAGGAG